MKALSLLLSIIVFFVAGYYFVIDFYQSGEINHFIYMSLLVVLMLICIVGVLINVPMIIKERRKMNLLMRKKMQQKSPQTLFDFTFET